MTPADGFGMLAVGMTAILIAGIIIWLVINRMQKDEITEEEKERLDKLYGRKRY